MTNEEIIIEKFHACTGVQKHVITGWYNSEEPKSFEGIDLDKAKRIIEEYSMAKYSKLLLNYMQFKKGHLNHFKQVVRSDDNKVEIEKKSELVNFMEHVLSKGKIKSAQINKTIGLAQITDKYLITTFVDTVKAEFKKRQYHITPLTAEEAKRNYKTGIDKEWFDSWKQEVQLLDEEGNKVAFEEIKEGKIYYDTDYNEMCYSKSIFDDMFYTYCISHSMERDIDLKLTQQLKLELEEETKQNTSKAGNKEKNRIISLVAFALADLMRIDEFLFRTDLQSIDEITVSGNAGRFIYDLLYCFDMIENKTKPKQDRHKYAKDLIRNKKKQATTDPQLELRSQRLQTLKL